MKNEKSKNIILASHEAVAEVLSPGDLAVDLTVGNGKDTLFLWRTVGPEGCVAGFDIQETALHAADELLKSRGAAVTLCIDAPVPDFPAPGVHLILADHAGWSDYVTGVPKAVIANLGYLPGSDSEIVTRIPTTLAALEAAFGKLPPGGRLAVVCYVGHPGGREEAEAVEELFRKADEGPYAVTHIRNPDAEDAPFLVVGERQFEV